MRVISECLNNFDNLLQSLVQESEYFFSNFHFLVIISTILQNFCHSYSKKYDLCMCPGGTQSSVKFPVCSH